ncbi:hypothetical protein FKM82_018343 [Ascaphus truei]
MSTPKYFTPCFGQLKLKLICINFSVSFGRLIFRASDLDWLILKPEMLWNFPNKLKRFGKEVRGLEIVNNTSSGYSATLCVCVPVSTPLTSVLFLIWAAKGSMHNANKRGDNGHPCRVPLLILKRSDGKP